MDTEVSQPTDCSNCKIGYWLHHLGSQTGEVGRNWVGINPAPSELIDKGCGDQVTFFPSTGLGEVERSQIVVIVPAWVLGGCPPVTNILSLFHSTLCCSILKVLVENWMSQEYTSAYILTHFSRVWLCATLRYTPGVAHQASLSYGILQARILEQFAISFFRGYNIPVKRRYWNI